MNISTGTFNLLANNSSSDGDTSDVPKWNNVEVSMIWKIFNSNFSLNILPWKKSYHVYLKYELLFL